MRGSIPTVLALTIGLGPGTALAGPTWTKATSAHFELLTTAGDKKAREGILHFEKVRAFFAASTNVKIDTDYPVRVIAFSSDKEYKPYRAAKWAAAYYLSGRDRDTIVMKEIGASSYDVAVHEYTHLVLRRAG